MVISVETLVVVFAVSDVRAGGDRCFGILLDIHDAMTFLDYVYASGMAY